MTPWIVFQNGETINSTGSESGIIVKDEEIENSARITIEKNSQVAPFAITMGIYGLAFHTSFYSSIETAEENFQWFKHKIEEILVLLELPIDKRIIDWSDKQNQLLNELISR